MATNNITISNIIGATGSTYGIYTGATGTSATWNSATPTYYTTSSIYANTNSYSNDIIIRREGKNDIHVAETLEMLMNRLCIIQPAMDLIEKYPALREAYENYKMMEALLLGGDKENENE